jgi:hypothetical protein
MLDKLISILLGCKHEYTTFPQTQSQEKGMRVVCLGCGREFEYDWDAMRRGREVA